MAKEKNKSASSAVKEQFNSLCEKGVASESIAAACDKEGKKEPTLDDVKNFFLEKGKIEGRISAITLSEQIAKFDVAQEDFLEVIEYYRENNIIVDDADEFLENDFELMVSDVDKSFDENEFLEESGEEAKDAERFGDRECVGEVNSTDSVKLYLKGIGNVQRLTPAEETELAKAMEKGNDPDATEQDRALAKCARDKLITANLPLVIYNAKMFRDCGMPLPDLITWGNMGLLKAAEKFDYHRGFKFSTYATWWIRQGIRKVISEQARTIYLPNNKLESIRKMKYARQQLIQELGLDREPTPEEISEKMDGALSPKDILELQRIARGPRSLEAPDGEDDDYCLADVLEDRESQSPENYAESALAKETVQICMETLTEREQKVLRLRYGFDDGCERTLEEIGQELGVTRERARQIQEKAEAKLKAKMKGIDVKK